MMYDSERVRAHEVYHNEKIVSRPVEPDNGNEEELWAKFEAQLDDSWGDDSYSFAESGCDEHNDDLEVPPLAGALIDAFPLLENTRRGHVLDIVKLLIEQELRRR